MPSFFIAETHTSRGFLFALWRRDPSGRVTILPWASPNRKDLRAVQRSLTDLGYDIDPVAEAEAVLAAAGGYVEGRPMALVDLDEHEQASIARTIAREILEADDRPSGVLRNLRTDVFVLVGRHLVAMS